MQLELQVVGWAGAPAKPARPEPNGRPMEPLADGASATGAQLDTNASLKKWDRSLNPDQGGLSQPLMSPGPARQTHESRGGSLNPDPSGLNLLLHTGQTDMTANRPGRGSRNRAQSDWIRVVSPRNMSSFLDPAQAVLHFSWRGHAHVVVELLGTSLDHYPRLPAGTGDHLATPRH